MIEIPPAALGPSMQSCVALSEVLSGIALLIRRDMNAEQRDKMLKRRGSQLRTAAISSANPMMLSTRLRL